MIMESFEFAFLACRNVPQFALDALYPQIVILHLKQLFNRTHNTAFQVYANRHQEQDYRYPGKGNSRLFPRLTRRD